MHCPTREEVIGAVLSLLPRGRAWSNNEGGPEKPVYAAFAAGAFEEGTFTTEDRIGTVLYQYWASFGEVLAFFVKRVCDLTAEMFCQSIVETRDQWLTEYGLPDACDPFPDLCTKVAAIGGTRCEYYQAIAARMGWSIQCLNGGFPCGARAGCSRAGNARAGSGRRANFLTILVFTADSPAYVTPRGRDARAGRYRAGQFVGCVSGDLTPLRCVLERVVHGHMTIQYLPV